MSEEKSLYEHHKEENDLIRAYWVNRSIRAGNKELAAYVPPEGTDYFYDSKRAWELLRELFQETNNVKMVLEGPGRIVVFASWNFVGKDAGYKFSGRGAMEPFAIARAFVEFTKAR